MNVQEMHIEINQSLQQVAGNTTRKYYSEEIDWVINKVQHRYIQSCLKPIEVDGRPTNKFTVDQLKVDALRHLITVKELPTTIGLLNTVEAILPCNYMYLLSDASEVLKLCGAELTTESVSTELRFLKLTQTTKSTPLFYITSSLTVDSTTLNVPASMDVPNNYYGYETKQDIMFLRNWYLDKLRAEGIEVYWERYGNVYKQGNFIFVDTSSSTLTHDGVVVTQQSTKTISGTRPTNELTGSVVDNRLVNSDQVSTLMSTPFYKTGPESPISELKSNILSVHCDSNLTVKRVYITYVRIPQSVSLTLGTDCEITEQFHQTICDLAVEYIMGRIKDGTGNQLITQNTENRVIL